LTNNSRLDFLKNAGLGAAGAATLPLLGASSRPLFNSSTSLVKTPLALSVSAGTHVSRSLNFDRVLPLRVITDTAMAKLFGSLGIFTFEERGVQYAFPTGSGGHTLKRYLLIGPPPSPCNPDQCPPIYTFRTTVTVTFTNSSTTWVEKGIGNSNTDGYGDFSVAGTGMLAYPWGVGISYAKFYHTIVPLLSTCLSDAIKLAAGLTGAITAGKAWIAANPGVTAIVNNWLALPTNQRVIGVAVGTISALIAEVGVFPVLAFLAGTIGLWELSVAARHCVAVANGDA